MSGRHLGPDTYQLVFVRGEECREVKSADGVVNHSLISSVIYRYYREYGDLETLRIRWLEEANRGEAVAVTGPYVGLMAGAQGHVENAALISAHQYLGSSALLRRIRIEAFDELVRLCGLSPPCEEMDRFDPGGARIRAACNRLAEDVGRDADEWRYFCGAGQGRDGRDDE
jgi:hypothetical protein